MPKATSAASAAPAAEIIKNSDGALAVAFKAARRVSTPIVAIETPDPASTIAIVRKALSDSKPDNTPVLAWDCAQGLRGVNDLGISAMKQLGLDDPAVTIPAVETLILAARLPGHCVVFMHNLHRQLSEVAVVQALWNLRDIFKLNRRMIVALGPAFKLPSELAGDIIVLDEPLPTREELSSIFDQQFKNADLPLADDETRAASLDAIVGLSSFTAEQVSAMALTKEGVNVDKLWERKVKAIQGTKGLRVWQGRPGDTTLEELKGIDNVVNFMQKLRQAEAFSLIVFMDEMDKAFAGGMSDHTGDSGVAKDQVGTLLSYIEDTSSLGVLLAGVAGTGKTQLVKALGVASGKPVIVFDLGDMKGGVVGQSEENIRVALKVVTATAEGRVLFVGTANRTTIFTPELNRRFPDQFFYDVPDDAGRRAIWEVYVKKNGLTPSQAEVPPGFDRGWTGAEIKRACERAVLFGDTVVEAAKFIIPSSVSGAAAIDALRRQADGRFLSATYPGLYRRNEAEQHEVVVPTTHRQIEVG